MITVIPPAPVAAVAPSGPRAPTVVVRELVGLLLPLCRHGGLDLQPRNRLPMHARCCVVGVTLLMEANEGDIARARDVDVADAAELLDLHPVEVLHIGEGRPRHGRPGGAERP